MVVVGIYFHGEIMHLKKIVLMSLCFMASFATAGEDEDKRCHKVWPKSFSDFTVSSPDKELVFNFCSNGDRFNGYDTIVLLSSFKQPDKILMAYVTLSRRGDANPRVGYPLNKDLTAVAKVDPKDILVIHTKETTDRLIITISYYGDDGSLNTIDNL